MRVLFIVGIVIASIATVSVGIVWWEGITSQCHMGGLSTIIDIRGTPSVANPVYHGQQTRVNITAEGQMGR